MCALDCSEPCIPHALHSFPKQKDTGVVGWFAVPYTSQQLSVLMPLFLLRRGVENIQCSSEAGTQGHDALVRDQKTSSSWTCECECLTALFRANVLPPGTNVLSSCTDKVHINDKGTDDLWRLMSCSMCPSATCQVCNRRQSRVCCEAALTM